MNNTISDYRLMYADTTSNLSRYVKLTSDKIQKMNTATITTEQSVILKVIVSMLVCLSFFMANMHGQIGRFALSPVQKIEQKIGLTDIAIVYSRPSIRGREIFGGLVPYDALWRTGANRNTTIEFSEDVVIDGKRMDAGKYAVFSIPNKDQWEIVFYKDTDNWDVPEDFDNNKVAGRILVNSSPLDNALEVFSISIGDFTNFEMDLNISWSKVTVSVPIELTNRELMDDRIERALNGPAYADYYAAAEYQMEAGKEYEKGLQWIAKAMEVTDEVTWWDLRIQAILLMESGQKAKAKKVAEEGMAMAQKVNRAYGINQFNIILEKLEE